MTQQEAGAGYESADPAGEDVEQLIARDAYQQRVRLRASEKKLELLATEQAKRLIRQDEAKERGSLKDRILGIKDLRELPRPRPLVRDVIYTGAVGLILGDSTVGKTWVGISIACSAASGQIWPQWRNGAGAQRIVKTLYVAAEDGGSICDRIDNWGAAHSTDMADHPIDVHPGAINILDPIQVEELCDVARAGAYGLVFIDTVSASTAGEEETNENFALAIRHMRMLNDALNGGSTFLVHHFGKDKTKGARGGSALFDNADVVWTLEGDIDGISMTCKKWKIAALRHPWNLHLDRSKPRAVHITETPRSAAAAMSADDTRHAVLAKAITDTVGTLHRMNDGHGPNVRELIEALREKGVGARTQLITDLASVMAGDRRLRLHAGPRGARFLSLPGVQTESDQPSGFNPGSTPDSAPGSDG